MPIWIPPKKISPKEFVGRRAFGSRVFEKEDDKVLRYRIDIFLDKRAGTGLSVDRLGVRAACPEVLAFLSPLCDEMAEKGSTEFVGWAQVKVEDLKGIIIKATDAVGEDNSYHAEIDRTDYPTAGALRALAFRLCVHASKYDFIKHSEVIR